MVRAGQPLSADEAEEEEAGRQLDVVEVSW
jgi:hypothetical protein